MPKPAGRWRVSQTLLGGGGDIISQARGPLTTPFISSVARNPLLTSIVETRLPEHPARRDYDPVVRIGNSTTSDNYRQQIQSAYPVPHPYEQRRNYGVFPELTAPFQPRGPLMPINRAAHNEILNYYS
jgi:hypothetical protein